MRQIIHDKKANTTSIVVVFSLVAILSLSVFGMYKAGLFTQAVGQGQETTKEKCDIATTLTFNGIDKINKGTAVTLGHQNISLNGGPGIPIPTALSSGDKISALVGDVNYIDALIPEFILECGANTITAEVYATDDASFRIFNNDGNKVTDNTCSGSGAVNQTESSSSISMQVCIDGKSDQSSGDLVITFEATNTTEVKDFTLSGFDGVTKVNVPEYYSMAGANSVAKSFRVSQLIDGRAQCGTLVIDPESTKTIGLEPSGTTIYVTADSEEADIDVNGKFIVGVANSDGTATYEDTWDYDFCIGNAN